MRALVLIALVLGCSVAIAEPTALEFNKKIKNRSSVKYIRAVHEEIPANSTNIARIRHRIVAGMLDTKDRAWTYEGEGEGFILARFDYRGDTILIRVEYNQRMVQLKFHDSSDKFECLNLRDGGICYKNQRGYYNYTQNLRISIIHQMQYL